MPKIKAADTVAALFVVATYKGARVSRPDTETLLVEGVKGSNLVLRFRRRLRDWHAAGVCTSDRGSTMCCRSRSPAAGCCSSFMSASTRPARARAGTWRWAAC